MRVKIILGNLLIVLALGLIGYFWVRSSLENSVSEDLQEHITNDQALFERSWKFSGLSFQTHVAERAGTDEMRAVFRAIDITSRRTSGFTVAESIANWFNNSARGRSEKPHIVLIVDETGKGIARDTNQNQYFDRSMLEIPSLSATLQDGHPHLDVWNKADEQKLLQVAMSPIRGDQGSIVGALVVGYDITNGLATEEAKRLDREVAFIAGDKVYANSAGLEAYRTELTKHLFGPMQAQTTGALTGANSAQLDADIGEAHFLGTVAPLPFTPSGEVGFAVLSNQTEALSIADVAFALLVLTLIGMLFVTIYGFIIGGAFERSLVAIEEGVLAIINGNHGLRLDTKRGEFGGLAYRINQLVNVFTGVDETDADGRVSASSSATWTNTTGQSPVGTAAPAPTGGGGGGGGSDVIDDAALAAQLAAEPEQQYYARVYREYVSAKQAIGEDVSNIPQDRFIKRLRGNADNLAKKYSCRMVRFKVQARDNQVALRPVVIR